jgi:sodium/potassium-transporting ATPase subunit alpha
MTIHKKEHPNGALTQFIKGAPERILVICSHILIDGVSVVLTEEHKEKFTKSYEYMAGKGHRVLAFAQNFLPGDAFPVDFVFDKDPINFPTVCLHRFLYNRRIYALLD